MRKGQNPAKYLKEVTKPAAVTVAVLNYIPFISGFYAELPDVLKTCIESIRTSCSKIEYDLLVFDNGSCAEIKQLLLAEQTAGNIQYLIFSEKNLGKGGAWNIILSAAPGEIIAYTDNDCLFSPGWLEKSIEILRTFPKTGMVTARPFRTNPDYYSSTLNWAKETPNVCLESGALIPFEVFREFDLSLGQSEDEIRTHYETTCDHKITYNSISAIAGASHWQFTAYKSVLAQFLPFDMSRPMGQVKQLDMRMNEAGYLRLMPEEALAMNMSNTTLNVAKDNKKKTVRKNARLLDFPPLKKILLWVYNRIFRWYYDE